VKPFLITALVSYFLGSIPFGFILVRVFHGEDIRRSGSGNIGATNVSRTSLALGVVTLLLDACKGLAAALVAHLLFPGNIIALSLAALFAVVGHIFPLWLKFHGGKGVATGLGGFILLAPKAVLICIAVFLALFALFRYVSVASVAAVSLFPIVMFALNLHRSRVAIVLTVATSALIVIKHRTNMARLLAGSEPRFHAGHG
jgi:glycerol-3-phosphate acyltransferase PlsY